MQAPELSDNTMKKTLSILFVLSLVLVFSGCKKFLTDQISIQQDTQGVSFSIASGSSIGGLKSDCFSTTASYAKLWLTTGNAAYNNGNPVQVDIFYISGIPYTNSIQLTPGTYTLTDFIIFNDNQTPSNTADDIVLAATPHTGSTIAPYVTHPLNITFTVTKFAKLMQPIECVCYQQSNYTDFGFTFFQIQEVTVRQQAFFGDLCILHISDYIGSLYQQQSAGLQPDMPAIFKIEVWRNGTMMNTFDNSAWKGEGQPLLVQYADRQGIVDNFEFRLNVLVKQGTVFNYTYVWSWYVSDATPINDPDHNGVIDFALGYCNPSADYQLSPWINLPPTSTYTISGNYGPGSMGTYINAALTNVPSGYFFGNGSYSSWCIDYNFSLNKNTAYYMVVYSSLYPNLLPTFAKTKPWDKINWLLNHLDSYNGYRWYDVQGAIWNLCGWTGPTKTGVQYPLRSLGNQMVTDANANGGGYKVPSGGNACLICIASGTPDNASTANVQVIVIKLDS